MKTVFPVCVRRHILRRSNFLFFPAISSVDRPRKTSSAGLDRPRSASDIQREILESFHLLTQLTANPNKCPPEKVMAQKEQFLVSTHTELGGLSLRVSILITFGPLLVDISAHLSWPSDPISFRPKNDIGSFVSS